MISAIIGRHATTPDSVINRINDMLGKKIQSPRDDYPGVYEVIDVTHVDIVQTGPGTWYGAAVVLMGALREETFDAEHAFFSAVKAET